MAEIYISLMEAADLEATDYEIIKKRVQRNPEKYQLKKEKTECGGKDLSMIALSSLSKKAVTAYKERQKLAEVPAVPGMEEVAVSGESEMPWYVNEDVDYFMEQHKTEWYTAMELGNIIREFLDYDSAGRTEFAEHFAQERLGKGKRTLYRYAKSYLEASAWADKFHKEDGGNYEFYKVLCLCRKPKEAGTFPSFSAEVKQVILNIRILPGIRGQGKCFIQSFRRWLRLTDGKGSHRISRLHGISPISCQTKECGMHGIWQVGENVNIRIKSWSRASVIHTISR